MVWSWSVGQPGRHSKSIVWFRLGSLAAPPRRNASRCLLQDVFFLYFSELFLLLLLLLLLLYSNALEEHKRQFYVQLGTCFTPYFFIVPLLGAMAANIRPGHRVQRAACSAQRTSAHAAWYMAHAYAAHSTRHAAIRARQMGHGKWDTANEARGPRHSAQSVRRKSGVPADGRMELMSLCVHVKSPCITTGRGSPTTVG